MVYENLDDLSTFINDKQSMVNNITSVAGGAVYLTNTEAKNVNRIFDDRLSYNKGAMVLEMLRFKMGDTAFFQGIKNYLADTNLAFNYASTTQFKTHMEAVYGTSITEFFNDWVYNQGYPSYQISATNTGTNQVTFLISQTQSHSSVSFFEMPLPIRVYGNNGEVLDSLGITRDRFVPCDVVRWYHQTLPFDSTTSLETVRTSLDEAIRTASVTNGGVEVLARWRAATAGRVSPSLRRAGVISDLLRSCRHAYRPQMKVWTEHVSVETEASIDLPDPNRESVLADFLRFADRHETAPTTDEADQLFDFSSAAKLLGEGGRWAETLRVNDVGERRRVLREAVVLAHDLLAEETEL